MEFLVALERQQHPFGRFGVDASRKRLRTLSGSNLPRQVVFRTYTVLVKVVDDELLSVEHSV